MGRSTLQHFDPGDKVRIVGNSEAHPHAFKIEQTGKIRRCLKGFDLYKVECDGFQQFVHAKDIEKIDTEGGETK